jgi:sulfoxide reductase heme-binding subunit YedZ
MHATSSGMTLPLAATIVRRSPTRLFVWPWLDRTGRLSWLRLTTLVLALLPCLALAWMLAAGDYGAEPFKQASRDAGVLAFRFLLITLMVTPLRTVADWPGVTQLRRMLGLTTLGYALAHLALYVAHMNGQVLTVAVEIVLRPYLTIGFVALLGLVALGWTSTDGWMKRLGRGWKRLHRLVVPIALLGLLHYFLQSKADVTQPVLMAGLLFWLMAWRALPAELRGSGIGLGAIAILSALATAIVEFAWYGLATNLPAPLILLANLDASAAPRPAAIVLLCGLGAAMIGALRCRQAAIRRARAPLAG